MGNPDYRQFEALLLSVGITNILSTYWPYILGAVAGVAFVGVAFLVIIYRRLTKMSRLIRRLIKHLSSPDDHVRHAATKALAAC